MLFKKVYLEGWTPFDPPCIIWRHSRQVCQQHVDDLPGQRPLRSTNINRLVVPPVGLSTVGSRAFVVAAPHIWNRLPTDVVAENSLSTFFILAIISWYNLLTVTSPNQWSLQWLCHLGHFKNWLIDWLTKTTDNYACRVITEAASSINKCSLVPNHLYLWLWTTDLASHRHVHTY